MDTRRYIRPTHRCTDLGKEDKHVRVLFVSVYSSSIPVAVCSIRTIRVCKLNQPGTWYHNTRRTYIKQVPGIIIHAYVYSTYIFFVFVFQSSLSLSSLTRRRFYPRRPSLLDKPWSQVSTLLPPGTCLYFLSRIGFSIPTLLVDFHRM